jgi:hypothetical protein
MRVGWFARPLPLPAIGGRAVASGTSLPARAPAFSMVRPQLFSAALENPSPSRLPLLGTEFQNPRRLLVSAHTRDSPAQVCPSSLSRDS